MTNAEVLGLVNVVELLNFLLRQIDNVEIVLGEGKLYQYLGIDLSIESSILAIRAFVTDLGMTVKERSLIYCAMTTNLQIYEPVTLGLLAWRDIKTFAGWTLCLCAIFLTTSFVSRGELSDPRGQKAVGEMPFSVQKLTTSCWGHELDEGSVSG